MSLNYTDEQYAEYEAFLKTKEGTVLISSEDRTIRVNLLAFIDDLITRKITQRELERLQKPKILDAKGFRVN